MDQLRFSIPEVLSLIGVTQCVYILVYMLLRAGRMSRAGLPALYFLVLGAAFVSDFAGPRIGPYADYYYYFPWAAWFLGPPLSVLLIVQIAQIYKTPSFRHYWVLFLLPMAFGVSAWAVSGTEGCERLFPCEEMQRWLRLTGLLAGCFSLLTIWANRDIFVFAGDKKTGKDRYWLVLALIFTNIFFLLAVLGRMGPGMDQGQFVLIRTVLGLGFVYLAGTSLFRIYPHAVLVSMSEKNEALTAAEMAIARKIEELLVREKIYHESSYTRTDLARECGTSEAVISRVINMYFRKSFPQIINERRVEDAKRLLDQTQENIKTIAQEVGFNSVASFNRVFREIAGEAPSAYRKKSKG